MGDLKIVKKTKQTENNRLALITLHRNSKFQTVITKRKKDEGVKIRKISVKTRKEFKTPYSSVLLKYKLGL